MMETNLGIEMRLARKRLDLSLRDAAEKGGLQFTQLSRIERGLVRVPSRETLEAISYVYRLPLELLAQLVYLGNPEASVEEEDTPSVEEAVAV